MKTKYNVRTIETEEGRIATVTDPELLGKRVSDSKIVLDIRENFYAGILMEEDEIIAITENSYIVSFIGEKSVDMAVKHKLIHPEAVIRVKNIPYAMLVKTRF